MKLHGKVYIFILFRASVQNEGEDLNYVTFSNAAMNIKFTVSIMPGNKKKPELL